MEQIDWTEVLWVLGALALPMFGRIVIDWLGQIIRKFFS